MYRWYPRGRMGVPGQDCIFEIEADGPDPNDPTYVPTWRINALRHINNNDTLDSRVDIYQYAPDGTKTTVISDIRPPHTTRTQTLPPGSNYSMNDDAYGSQSGWAYQFPPA